MPLTGLIHETDRFVEIAHDLGATLMIPPWMAPEERDSGPDGWRRLGAALAEGAGKVRSAGLRVAWHNHDFEYRRCSATAPVRSIICLQTSGPECRTSRSTWDGWCVAGRTRRRLARYAARITGDSVSRTRAARHRAGRGWTATGDGIIDWHELWPLFLATRADQLSSSTTTRRTGRPSPGDRSII